jgi:hypothetical protein
VDTTEGQVLKSEMGCLEETVDAAEGRVLKSEIGTCFHISIVAGDEWGTIVISGGATSEL